MLTNDKMNFPTIFIWQKNGKVKKKYLEEEEKRKRSVQVLVKSSFESAEDEGKNSEW